MNGPGAADVLAPYVPRLLAEWDLDAGGSQWQTVDSTCCFVDISGFTALSERLARRGRIGAEELTEILNHVFSRMLSVAYAKGGSLLKFGGDALLLVFTRDDHATLGAEAAVAMRAALREARTLQTSVGRINLKMSVGLHSGDLLLFRVGEAHRELIVTGPVATMTTEMEGAADAGEILVSPALAARLPRASVGAPKGPGVLLRSRTVVEGGPGPSPARSMPAGTVAASVPRLLRDRLTDRTVESEHRIATVGFVKFKGVDDYLDERGPEATAAAVDAVVRAVQAEADNEGVTFLASDIDANGGKVILTTGVPTAQEDDEGRMLRAATAIVGHDLPLSVRIGVNTGHVFAANIGTDFRRTFTVMGDTVNLAARLMAAAESGQVLATAGVLDRSATLFRTEPLPPFMVKGKSKPVQAYAVGTAAGPRTLAYGSLPFRGRDAELARLSEVVTPGDDGRHGVAVVVGERGSGKTRLVTEFLALQGEAPTFVAQGEPNGGAVPYLPLRMLLRDAFGVTADDRDEAGRQLVDAVGAVAPDLVPLVPLLAPLVDADVPPTPQSAAVAEEFVRDQIGELLVALLDAAYTGPVLVVLEDTHWFDDSTGAVCARLADASRTREWKVVATRRPEDGGWTPVGDDTVELGPLGEDAARALIDEATADAPLRPQERDGIVSRAGGNPLFVEELLRIVRSTDVEGLPDSLDAIAMREIDALPVPARRMVRLASVLGRSFDPGLLDRFLDEELLEVSGDERRQVAGVLVAQGPGRVGFRHAMLQEAAYRSLPYRTRLALHRNAGRVIEAVTPDPDDAAAVLSSHFLLAQDWERAWHYAPIAARRAQAAHAPGEAGIHFERALVAARKLGTIESGDLAPILRDLGESLTITGLYDRADDAFRRAALASRDDPVERARIAERRGTLLGEYLGRTTAAIRQIRAGGALIDALEAPPVDALRIRAKLLACEASIRARQGKLDEAVRVSASASDLAESVGEERALAEALGVHDTSLVELGRAHEASHMGRVLEIYDRLGDAVHVGMTLSNLGAIAYFESAWDEAIEYFDQAAVAATAAGDLAVAALSRKNFGEICVAQGRVEQAVELLVPALRTLESYRYPLGVATTRLHLGRARAFLGDVDEGLSLVESAVAAFDDLHLVMESLEAVALLGEVLAFAGRFGPAHDAVATARHLDRSVGETPITAIIDRVEATVATATDPDRARTLLAPAVARARRLGAAYDLLLLLTLGARLDPTQDTGEATALRAKLGVVELVVLPAG